MPTQSSEPAATNTVTEEVKVAPPMPNEPVEPVISMPHGDPAKAPDATPAPPQTPVQQPNVPLSAEPTQNLSSAPLANEAGMATPKATKFMLYAGAGALLMFGAALVMARFM